MLGAARSSRRPWPSRRPPRRSGPRSVRDRAHRRPRRSRRTASSLEDTRRSGQGRAAQRTTESDRQSTWPRLSPASAGILGAGASDSGELRHPVAAPRTIPPLLSDSSATMLTETALRHSRSCSSSSRACSSWRASCRCCRSLPETSMLRAAPRRARADRARAPGRGGRSRSSWRACSPTAGSPTTTSFVAIADGRPLAAARRWRPAICAASRGLGLLAVCSPPTSTRRSRARRRRWLRVQVAEQIGSHADLGRGGRRA
jgi:hypothetical protein